MHAHSVARRAVLALGALAACVTSLAPGTSEAAIVGANPPVSQPVSILWRHRAERTLVLADAAAAQKGSNPMVWANLTRTSARLYGWGSPVTQGYLGKVMAARLPSGGWGLGEPADAFGDGTINPASTTYSVTTGEQVGALLLEGFRAGVIDRSVVDGAVGALMSLPAVTLPGGACLSYSSSPYDTPTATSWCVNNANAAAGLFLRKAAELGIVRPGQRELADAILAYDASQQLPSGLWPYMTGVTAPQDLDHNSLNTAVHLAIGEVGPDQPGGRSLAATYALPVGRDPLDRLAFMNLVPYAPEQCVRTLPMATELTALVPTLNLAPPYQHDYLEAVRYSQIALASARNAEACPAPAVRRTPRRR